MGAPTDLSVQLYSVRTPLAADFAGTLSRLRDIGFTRVEPFGMLDHAAELKAGLADNGFSAPTTHQSLDDVDLGRVFATAAGLGIGTVIQPVTRPEQWTSRQDVERVATLLNTAAAKAAEHGVRVGYHNHDWELRLLLDGTTSLEVLAELVDPAVVLEVDTYWAYVGGADVPALLERLGERVVALHIKDGDGSLDNKKQVAVGSGSVPVDDYMAAAPAALFVVELDDSEGDLVEAVGASREFLVGGAR